MLYTINGSLSGYVGNARLASTRILIITMILFSLLIFLFYSLFIIGSLLTDPPKSIKTVRQLTNSPFKFRVDTVPYVRDIFNRDTDPDTVQLYSKVMQSQEQVLVPLPIGVHLMRQGLLIIVVTFSGSLADFSFLNKVESPMPRTTAMRTCT